MGDPRLRRLQITSAKGKQLMGGRNLPGMVGAAERYDDLCSVRRLPTLWPWPGRGKREFVA